MESKTATLTGPIHALDLPQLAWGPRPPRMAVADALVARLRRLSPLVVSAIVAASGTATPEDHDARADDAANPPATRTSPAALPRSPRRANGAEGRRFGGRVVEGVQTADRHVEEVAGRGIDPAV